MRKLLIILLILPFMATSQTFEEGMMSMTEFTVKQGHVAQFMDGVKKWKECYNENEGTDSWNFWSRVQGESNVFGVTGLMPNWAAMDKKDMANDACRMIAMTYITPHVEKSHNSLTKTMLDWSKKTVSEDVTLAWVSYFRVNDRGLFAEVIQDVTQTMVKEEGNPRDYWYSFMGGGEDEANYIATQLFSSYAALDEDDETEGPFELYTRVHGDKKADALMKKWKMSVDAYWSYLWEHNAELSN